MQCLLQHAAMYLMLIVFGFKKRIRSDTHQIYPKKSINTSSQN